MEGREQDTYDPVALDVRVALVPRQTGTLWPLRDDGAPRVDAAWRPGAEQHTNTSLAHLRATTLHMFTRVWHAGRSPSSGQQGGGERGRRGGTIEIGRGNVCNVCHSDHNLIRHGSEVSGGLGANNTKGCSVGCLGGIIFFSGDGRLV